MVTAAAGAKGGAVYVPVFAPIEPLVLLVVQVSVPFDVVKSTHQVTAVLVVPVTEAVNG
jgi:biotin transporter BioY